MRICFFGESFVNGFGDPTYQGWVGRLCQNARTRGDEITLYNCSIRRVTSDLLCRVWLEEALPRLPPEYKGAVVFSYGANDSRIENGDPVVPFARQMDNTKAILTEASARWPTLMVGPPQLRDEKRDADAAERSQGMQRICDQLGVPFFDTYSASNTFKKWYVESAAGDGAHPGEGGYAELAALVDSWSSWRALLDTLRS